MRALFNAGLFVMQAADAVARGWRATTQFTGLEVLTSESV